MNFTVRDLTAGCAVGQPLSWNVLVNGTVVGTFGWAGGSGMNLRTVMQSSSFPPQAPGAVVLRLPSTTTVCSGGSAWGWVAGGTAALR